jgi:Mg2+ and Co2+ transporter CorA
MSLNYRENEMNFKSYLLSSGKLLERTGVSGLPEIATGSEAEIWYDITDAEPEELSRYISTLELHPLMLNRCLDKANTPGVISYGKTVFLEYPVALNLDAAEPSYVSIILQYPVLVTVRHSALSALDDMIRAFTLENESGIDHLVQLVYMIIDELTDLSVQAETVLRDQIMNISKDLADNPAIVKEKDLTSLRWEVEKLVSLIENQLYCVTGLSASDNDALQEPHRKAYIQDLVSEVEIAQRGIYRLEARVKDLFDSYQMASGTRVEKRLRILTIVSAITLPFSLIAGLLGMNVGGLPGTQDAYGFIIVIAVMFAIAVAELWYFRHKGWFD